MREKRIFEDIVDELIMLQMSDVIYGRPLKLNFIIKLTNSIPMSQYLFGEIRFRSETSLYPIQRTFPNCGSLSSTTQATLSFSFQYVWGLVIYCTPFGPEFNKSKIISISFSKNLNRFPVKNFSLTFLIKKIIKSLKKHLWWFQIKKKIIAKNWNCRECYV